MVSTLMDDGTTDKTVYRAEDWHTDDSYFEVPAKATLLHSIEIPSRGGATWFCNMHSVYDALPEATQQRIDGKRAIHGYDTPRARNRPVAAHATGNRGNARCRASAGAHAPVTGRKGLYLNPNRLDRIVGLPRAESDALLDELADEARKPRHHYGHVWSGRCRRVGQPCHHAPRGERLSGGRAAIMQRVLIQGDKPF